MLNARSAQSDAIIRRPSAERTATLRDFRSMTAMHATMDAHDAPAHGPQQSLSMLAVGAIGVVFGDIGTSPLYALKTSFAGGHPLPVDAPHVFGVVSLIFWTMLLVVTIKYVLIILRADNRGEGGSLALLSLIARRTKTSRWSTGIVVLGVLATALFYGDAIITPAISVLSAVEGLTVVGTGLAPLVLPVSIAILIGLFLIQARGTARVGVIFGPVMVAYFLIVAVLGVSNIILHPDIVAVLNPWWGVQFFALDPKLAFLALGAIVLSVTGAEALYADMGHFGRKPIAIAWLYFAFPCLMLNYMGQGALLLANPAAIDNPFFLMAPEWARLSLVILATIATIIASQAVISGAFSVTRQAVQLAYLPRMRILHTSAHAEGQIYVPLVNWALLVLVIAVVLGFRSSDSLASAYGIAVTGTMFISSCMLAVLATSVWRWPRIVVVLVIGTFLLVDGAYFASNLTKIPDGGWFPLTVAAAAFTLLTTWARGRALMRDRLHESAMPLGIFAKSARTSATQVAGTAVFLTASPAGVPPALLHNLKHNKVLHARNVLLTVQIDDVPFIEPEARVEVRRLEPEFWRIVLHYGFMQEINVPADLKQVSCCGDKFKMADTSFYLGRQTLIAGTKRGMPRWRELLFAAMLRNAETAMEFFKLPSNRVVELGSQVDI
jgi:KUP system potassium uptake protein